MEQSSLPKGGGGGLRATVDGDAKRNRRHSSDESAGGGSVTEIDPSRYLGSYKHSTPMQPGQQCLVYSVTVAIYIQQCPHTFLPMYTCITLETVHGSYVCLVTLKSTGQKMGEYDNMFLNQNARDADKPRRPSLHNITTSPSRGQQRTTT